MTAHCETFSVRTHGKGTVEITREIAAIVTRSGIKNGTVTVFVRHTSASLVIMENADPSARRDLEMFFENWFQRARRGSSTLRKDRTTCRATFAWH